MEIPKKEQAIFKKIIRQEIQIEALEKENGELKLLLNDKNEPLNAIQQTIKNHITYCLREYSQYPPEDIKIGYEEIQKLKNLLDLKKILIK